LFEPIQRLEAEIARTKLEIEQRKTPQPSVWVDRSMALVSAAESALQRHHMDAAWALVLDARRALIPLLTAEERRALATSLRFETRKYQGWRQMAVERLLDGSDPPDAATLSEAVFHIDTGHANRFRELRSRRNELLTLMVVLILALGATLGVLLIGDDFQTNDVSLGNEKLVALAPLLGALGACISTIQRTSRRQSMRVPDQRAAALVSIIRPMTGAGAAFIVLAGAQAGLVGDNTSTLLLAAFAAGFSERYILRFVEDAEPSEPETPRPPAGGGSGKRPTVGEGPTGPYFRAGVGMVVVNDSGLVLALERADVPGNWQFPQGGIEANEDPLRAAYRELHEETGLKEADVELLAELPGWLTYELPTDLRSPRVGLGQVQRWFLFRLRRASGATIDLVREVADFRKPVYQEIQEALKLHVGQKGSRKPRQRLGT
jgi:putative (di)nucleoside polyphosphate hydrolase